MTKLLVASSNQQLDALLEIVCVKLQLPKSHFETAESRYHSVGDWLLAPGSSIRRYDPAVYAQGSLSLGTTVKPYLANEFDLDLVCELQLSGNYTPGAVYEAIWNRMAEHQTYRRMMRRLRRCIRLEYANEFHLDIVPAVPDWAETGAHILVPDLHADLAPSHPKNNIWKPSNPRDYKKWFRSRCHVLMMEALASAEPLPPPEPIHRKPALKRAVQLLKRWRDIEFDDRKHLEPTSIILTTLAGHFHGREMLASDALANILDRIVDMRENGKDVCETNPANPKEKICERWREKPESLKAFDVSIREFQRSWHRLVNMRGLKEITAELKRLFGENPVDQAVREFAERNLNLPRGNGELWLERSTRRVNSGNPLAAVGAGAAMLPIKDTTFHGNQ